MIEYGEGIFYSCNGLFLIVQKMNTSEISTGPELNSVAFSYQFLQQLIK
jgi:hypothetical protein